MLLNLLASIGTQSVLGFCMSVGNSSIDAGLDLGGGRRSSVVSIYVEVCVKVSYVSSFALNR